MLREVLTGKVFLINSSGAKCHFISYIKMSTMEGLWVLFLCWASIVVSYVFFYLCLHYPTIFSISQGLICGPLKIYGVDFLPPSLILEMFLFYKIMWIVVLVTNFLGFAGCMIALVSASPKLKCACPKHWVNCHILSHAIKERLFGLKTTLYDKTTSYSILRVTRHHGLHYQAPFIVHQTKFSKVFLDSYSDKWLQKCTLPASSRTLIGECASVMC